MNQNKKTATAIMWTTMVPITVPASLVPFLLLRLRFRQQHLFGHGSSNSAICPCRRHSATPVRVPTVPATKRTLPELPTRGTWWSALATSPQGLLSGTYDGTRCGDGIVRNMHVRRHHCPDQSRIRTQVPALRMCAGH